MKLILKLITLIFILQITNACAQNYFRKRYTSSAANWGFYATRIGELPGQEFAMIATLNIQQRGALFKLDAYGTPLFCKIYSADSTNSGNLDSRFDDMVITHDSSILIVGTFDNSVGTSIGSVVKVDLNGNVLWSKWTGGNSNNRIVRTLDDKYVVYNRADGQAVKFDVIGNLINHKKIGFGSNYPSVMRQTNDYGFIHCGRTNGMNKAYFIKQDSTLNIVFAKEYPEYTEVTDARQTADSGFVCVLSKVNQETALMKTDTSGNPMWCLTFGDSSRYNYGGNLIINSNNTISFMIRWYAGLTYYAGIFNIDMNGNVLSAIDSFVVWDTFDWIKTSDGKNCILTVRGPTNTSVYPYIFMNDSALSTMSCMNPKPSSYPYAFTSPNFIDLNLVTSQPFFNFSSRDIYAFDTTPMVIDSCLVLNISEIKPEFPILVYPNPATDYISIQCKQSNPITLKMFNSVGNEIITIYLRESAQIATKSMENGIYFWKAISDDGLECNGKIVIIK